MMNLEMVTVQDCDDMFNLRDCVIILNDGKVSGFRPKTDAELERGSRFLRNFDDSEKIKRWMDDVVDFKRREEILFKFGDMSIIGDRGHVCVHNGICDMASAVGAKMKEENRNDNEFPFRYSFIYKNISFSQLSSHALS